MTVTAIKDERSDVELLRDIEERYGAVTPEAVVTEAAGVTHPWHNRFEWNDSEAAHRYRLDQARTVIRSVRFEIEYKTLTIKPPEWVRDPRREHDEQGYTRLLFLRRAKNQRADLLRQEIARAVGCLQRALNIAAALGEMDTASRVDSALEILGVDA